MNQTSKKPRWAERVLQVGKSLGERCYLPTYTTVPISDPQKIPDDRELFLHEGGCQMYSGRLEKRCERLEAGTNLPFGHFGEWIISMLRALSG